MLQKTIQKNKWCFKLHGVRLSNFWKVVPNFIRPKPGERKETSTNPTVVLDQSFWPTSTTSPWGCWMVGNKYQTYTNHVVTCVGPENLRWTHHLKRIPSRQCGTESPLTSEDWTSKFKFAPPIYLDIYKLVTSEWVVGFEIDIFFRSISPKGKIPIKHENIPAGKKSIENYGNLWDHIVKLSPLTEQPFRPRHIATLLKCMTLISVGLGIRAFRDPGRGQGHPASGCCRLTFDASGDRL